MICLLRKYLKKDALKKRVARQLASAFPPWIDCSSAAHGEEEGEAKGLPATEQSLCTWVEATLCAAVCGFL